MGDINTNDSAPSSADSMGDTNAAGGVAAVASEATEKLGDAVGHAVEGTRKIYRAGNDRVGRAVDPIPIMIAATAAGFAVGYLLGLRDRG